MTRVCRFVSAAMILVTIGCGVGSAPTSPSRAVVGSPATILSVSTASALFGASAVDFARCLQAAEDNPVCVAAARIQRRTAGAAATAPAAPINLSSASSGSTVTLTWGAPSSGDPVATYIIEAGSGPGLANLANFTTNSTATSFSASGVGAGTYYLRVRAQNAGGSGAASNESILVVGSTGCTTAPNAPAGLAMTVSGSTVTLIWSAPAGGCPPSSYVLQAGSSAGSSDLANANVGAATSYVASGIGAGTYYVRVRALNTYGQSTGSNEVVVIVTAGAPVPVPGGAGGTWVGLAPDGVINVSPTCGREAADVQFVITQTGSTIAGTLTARIREASPVLTEPCFTGTVGSIRIGSLTGTVNGNSVSFTLVFPQTSGPPEVNVASGTFTSTRMTGTMTIADRADPIGQFNLNAYS